MPFYRRNYYDILRMERKVLSYFYIVYYAILREEEIRLILKVSVLEITKR